MAEAGDAKFSPGNAATRSAASVGNAAPGGEFEGAGGVEKSTPAATLRSFLFLQGVNTPFFPRLADQLFADGHRIHRINFNAGDTVYWGARSATAFRGGLQNLPDFLKSQFCAHDVTDIALFGDRRPIHLPAIALAKQSGIRVHVFEEGYFRPHWVTLERDGVNADSLLPRDPAWFRPTADRMPNASTHQPFPAPFSSRALYDMAYHLCNLGNIVLFPRYRTHRPVVSALEYLGWARRFAKMPFYKSRDKLTIANALTGDASYFLLPLQLDSDAQIRDHSPLKNMREVMTLVMTSFANHAASNARLVIKNHPLDTGFTDFARHINKLSQQLALQGRVDYLESGDLDALLAARRPSGGRCCAGLVTVNSTVGLSALGLGCPTITLSNPAYNLPGLTFQDGLDTFWQNPVPPDAELFKCFKNILIHTTQINGGFYSAAGIALAVKNAAQVLTAEQSPLESLR